MARLATTAASGARTALSASARNACAAPSSTSAGRAATARASRAACAARPASSSSRAACSRASPSRSAGVGARSLARSRSSGSSAATIRTARAPTFEIGPVKDLPDPCWIPCRFPCRLRGWLALRRLGQRGQRLAAPERRRGHRRLAEQRARRRDRGRVAPLGRQHRDQRRRVEPRVVVARADRLERDRVAERPQRPLVIADAHRAHPDRQHQRRRGGRRRAQRRGQRRVDLRRSPFWLEQLGEVEPVVGQTRIAMAARLAQRDGRFARHADGRQLGAEDVQEAQARGPDPIDPLLGHLDHRPFTVAARLFGVERVPAPGPIDDRPQPGRPVRDPRRPARARDPRHRLVHREEPRLGTQQAAVVRGEKGRQPGGGAIPMTDWNRASPSGAAPSKQRPRPEGPRRPARFRRSAYGRAPSCRRFSPASPYKQARPDGTAQAQLGTRFGPAQDSAKMFGSNCHLAQCVFGRLANCPASPQIRGFKLPSKNQRCCL